MCPVTRDHPFEDSDRGVLGTPPRKGLVRGVGVEVGGLFGNSSGLHAQLTVTRPQQTVALGPIQPRNPATPVCLFLVYGCFFSTRTWLSSCDRDHRTWKAESVSCLALCRKLADSSSNT